MVYTSLFRFLSIIDFCFIVVQSDERLYDLGWDDGAYGLGLLQTLMTEPG